MTTENMMEVTVNGVAYSFDPEKDHELKRGILDPYTFSEKDGFGSDNDNEWVVLDDYIFWSTRLQEIIVIPRWFITDLASIPKVFRSLISVNQRHRLASLPHDVAYRKSNYGYETDHSQKVYDKVIIDFCKLYGVPSYRRFAIYTALRIGGRFNFGVKEKPAPMFTPMEHRLIYQNMFTGCLDLPVETEIIAEFEEFTEIDEASSDT